MEIPVSATKKLQRIFNRHFEQFCWIAALLLLFLMKEEAGTPSLCFFRWLGIQSCPGCGIGHAIRDALHLQLTSSFHHHPLGIPAVIIILNRIKQLSFTQKLYSNES